MLRILSLGLALLTVDAAALAQPARLEGPAPAPAPVAEVPSGALFRLGTLRFRTQRPQARVVFSPDGKQIVTGGTDGTINYWDAATGQHTAVLPFAGGVVARVAFSPDGKYLAAAEQMGFVAVYDAASRRRLFLRHPDARNQQLHAIAWRDSATLVVVELGGNVHIIAAADGSLQKSFAIDARSIVSIACSPDGKQFAGISQDSRKLQAWNLDDGKESIKFEPPTTDAPPGLPDLNMIINTPGRRDRPARPPTAPPGSFPATQFRPTQMCWSSDGKYIVAGSQDRLTPVWDAKTGKVVRQFPAGYAMGLTIFPGGRFLAAGASTGEIHVFGLASMAELRVAEAAGDQVQDIAASPDGSLLAVVGYGQTIRVLEMDTGHDRSAQSGHRGALSALTFLADNKRLVTAGQDGTFIVWDAAGGKELERQRRNEFAVSSMAPGADGDGVVFAGNQAYAMQWAPGAKEVKRFVLSTGSGYAPTVSPDGRVTAHVEGQVIHLYSLPDGKKLASLNSSARAYIAAGQMVLSPRARFAAVYDSGNQRRIRIWSATTGKDRNPIPLDQEPQFHPYKMAFSPDTRLLICIAGNHEVRVWDTISGALRLQIPGDGAVAYTALAMTPDQSTLIVGTSAGAIRLVDLYGGGDSGLIPGHQGEVRALAVSSDGKYLASGAIDTTVVVWDLPALLRRVPRRKLPDSVTSDQLDLWWAYLGSNEPSRCGEAIWALAHFPKESLALFKQRLRGIKAPDKDKIQMWIKDLDSERFVDRDRAYRGLVAAGEDARTALTRALEQDPSPEVRRRVEQLLKGLTTGVAARRLQPLRAIALLEGINSPEVKPLLEQLARESTDEDIRQEIDWLLNRKP